MTHDCADWMKASKCAVCQARLDLVNVLRLLRGWEQVLDGVYTGDQVAFDLERLLEGYGKSLGRDSSPLEAPTVTTNLYGRKVTIQVIPAYTRAGLARVARLCRAARSICQFEDEIAGLSEDGDLRVFWRILVGRVPECMAIVDAFLLCLRYARFEDDGADDYRPTTPLPLIRNPNISVTVQQLHDLPAGPFNPAAPWRSLAEAELESESEQAIVEMSQVQHPLPEPARHVVAAPPAATPAQPVATPVLPVAITEPPVAGGKRVEKSRHSGNPTTTLESFDLSLRSKRPTAGTTRMERSHRKAADTMSNVTNHEEPVLVATKGSITGSSHISFETPQADSEPKLEGRAAKRAKSACNAAFQVSVPTALDSKVNQRTQTTERHDANGRLSIKQYYCFFCGYRGREPRVRTDQPNNHRTGQSLPLCEIYHQLGGDANPYKVASFLVARWPQLHAKNFQDDQIRGNLKKALRRHFGGRALLSTKLSKKALQALETYRRTGETPSASSGYADPELE